MVPAFRDSLRLMGGYGTEAGDIFAILLIQHDVGVVTDISAHIVVRGQSKKLAVGTPAVVRANPAAS